jgi:hypothetical protein
MGYTTLWKRLSATQLNIAIQAFSLIAIFFEGYDQYALLLFRRSPCAKLIVRGVMGGVNASPRYVEEVGIGLPDGTVTDTTHQGGIVSIVRPVAFRSTCIDYFVVLSRGYLRLFCGRLGCRSHWSGQWDLPWCNFCHGRWSPSGSLTIVKFYPGRTCGDRSGHGRFVS